MAVRTAAKSVLDKLLRQKALQYEKENLGSFRRIYLQSNIFEGLIQITTLIVSTTCRILKPTVSAAAPEPSVNLAQLHRTHRLFSPQARAHLKQGVNMLGMS
jgi:hypothetical protein